MRALQAHARVAKLAVVAMLTLAASGAAAQNPSAAALWGSAGHVMLKTSGPQAGFAAAWQFDRADNGDIRIIKDEQRGPAKTNGTLMSVCDDHALLLKGIVPARSQALRELNDPILHLQLVMRLLARVLPQGPLAIGAAHSVNLSEQSTPVRVRKGPSAMRNFGAPWQVRGAVNRSAAGNIAFDLAFTYTASEVGGARQEMKMSGVWRQGSDLQKPPDSFAIADWPVYRVNSFAKTIAGKVELDVVAEAEPLQFKTMGELRARIEREWEENPRALKIMECK